MVGSLSNTSRMRRELPPQQRLFRKTRRDNDPPPNPVSDALYALRTWTKVTMDEPGSLEALKGLHRDLLAFTEARLPTVERLWVELELHVEEFRRLLDKPGKNNASRSTLAEGI